MRILATLIVTSAILLFSGCAESSPTISEVDYRCRCPKAKILKVPAHVEGEVSLTNVKPVGDDKVLVLKDELIKASTISKQRKVENKNLRKHIFFYIKQGKAMNELIKKRLADENSVNSRT
jgi:hypothetical protein